MASRLKRFLAALGLAAIISSPSATSSSNDDTAESSVQDSLDLNSEIKDETKRKEAKNKIKEINTLLAKQSDNKRRFEQSYPYELMLSNPDPLTGIKFFIIQTEKEYSISLTLERQSLMIHIEDAVRVIDFNIAANNQRNAELKKNLKKSKKAKDEGLSKVYSSSIVDNDLDTVKLIKLKTQLTATLKELMN